MPKEFSLDSRFEDIHKHKARIPDLYSCIERISQIDPEQTTETRIEVKSPIEQIRESWQTERHTPEFITRISQRIWDVAAPYIQIPFTRPDALPSTQRLFDRREKKGESALYQPVELATPEGRTHLAQAYRMIGNSYVPQHWSVQAGNDVNNLNLHAGWRWISGQVKAPNLDTSAEKAGKTLLKYGVEGIDENEYLALGLHMKTTQDVYPDQEGTWTWVLNSSRDDRLVVAGFNQYGNFDVDSSLNADLHDSALGVRRSLGVK